MQRSQVQRDFTPQQITTLLDALGSAYKGDASTNDPLIFQTVCHNHDHSGSFKLYYYPDSHQFHCYTHCGDNFDIYELIQRARDCTFYQALQFVQGVLHLDPAIRIGFANMPQADDSEEIEFLARYVRIRSKRLKAKEQASTFLPSTLIDLYSHVYPVEWLRDNISPEAIDRFNIRFDVSENEIIIPHYDDQGHLVGLRSRTFNQRKLADGGKYMPTILEGHDFRHPLRNYLYGLDKVRDTVKRTGKIALFEAEKSALQSYSYYGDNSFAVSVCGSNISSQQRDMILSLGVREVFICFDKEYHTPYTDESDEYADKILRLASLFTPYATTYVVWDTEGLLGYKDSPSDKGRDTLEKLMRTKFEIETK